MQPLHLPRCFALLLNVDADNKIAVSLFQDFGVADFVGEFAKWIVGRFKDRNLYTCLSVNGHLSSRRIDFQIDGNGLDFKWLDLIGNLDSEPG